MPLSSEQGVNPTPKTRAKRIPRPTPKMDKLARAVIVQGKSFRSAAVEAGYSQNTADLGPKYMRNHSPGMDMAFVEASKQLTWRPEEVKAVIRNRLLTDLSRGKSSGVERVAELLGRDKTIDLFVRSGDIQIGIFGATDECKVIDAPPPDIEISTPDKE